MKYILLSLFIIIFNTGHAFSAIEKSLFRASGYAIISGASLFINNETSEFANLEKKNVFRWDRKFMHKYDDGLALQSDILLLGMFAGNAGIFIKQNEMEEFFYFGELLLLQNCIGQWTKKISKRYRPYNYFNTKMTEKLRQDARHSFYSMHTSLAFSSATYLMDKIENNKYIWGTLLYGSAASVGVLRVVSGKHFISDVLVGSIVGYSVSLFYLKQQKENNIQFCFGINKLMVEIFF